MTYVYPYLPSMTLSISNIQFNYDFQYKIQLIYNVFAALKYMIHNKSSDCILLAAFFHRYHRMNS